MLSEGCLPECSWDKVVRVCLGRVDSHLATFGGDELRILLSGLCFRATLVWMWLMSVQSSGVGGRELRMAV